MTTGQPGQAAAKGVAVPAAAISGVEDPPPPPLSSYGIEDWVALALFWGLAVVVFLQFFTRYVLNDSLAWTEEIARYLLIMVAFIGGGMAVRRMSHIHVEFFYVYLSRRVAIAHDRGGRKLSADRGAVLHPAGNLMNIAGVTGRIYHFALSLVGWMKGGLAQVNIIGSVVFSGMSGTALADAAGIGTIEIKAMKDHGYPVEAAVGVTAASATLGPIFPPSLPFVIYGMMANASIGALFMAGILPGLVMTSADDADRLYLCPPLWLGLGHALRPAPAGRAPGLRSSVVMCFPLAVWLLITPGCRSISRC
jgi:hypothetical protein